MNGIAPLRWTLTHSAARPVLELAGSLDVSRAATMTTAITGALDDAPDGLIVDIAGVQVQEPIALTSVITVSHRAGAWPGCRLALCGASPYAAARLRALGVSRYIRLTANREAAVSYLAEAGPLPMLRESYPPSAGTVALARELAAQACVRWRIPAARDAALSVTSELVTNAVQHAGTAIEVRLSHTSHLLHIAVRDGSPEMPVQGRDDSFGLRLVDAFATRWGADPSANGKIVWAAVSLHGSG